MDVRILVLCISVVSVRTLSIGSGLRKGLEDNYNANGNGNAQANKEKFVNPAGTNLRLLGYDMIEPQADPARRKKRSNVAAVDLWPSATIPYSVDPKSDRGLKNGITGAMEFWNENTCVNFITRKNSDENYLLVTDATNLFVFASVGYTNGGRHTMNIGSVQFQEPKYLIHELAHVIGLRHEHTRTDRDDYVHLLEENIPNIATFNFTKNWPEDPESGSLLTDYDMQSIMHYDDIAFGGNASHPTMLPNIISLRSQMGTSTVPTFYDYKTVNLMYGCAQAANCPDTDCGSVGYLNKHCKCICPGASATESIDCVVGTTDTPVTTPAPTTEDPAPPCEDANNSCGQKAEICFEDTIQRTHCQKTCGLC